MSDDGPENDDQKQHEQPRDTWYEFVFQMLSGGIELLVYLLVGFVRVVLGGVVALLNSCS